MFMLSGGPCCISGQDDYSFEELFPMAIIGIIGGLLGRTFMDYIKITIFVYCLSISQLVIGCCFSRCPI